MKKLILALCLSLSPATQAYTDYSCVSACTSRGLQYQSCVEKCSDSPASDYSNPQREALELREQQNSDFDRAMRVREQNSGRSAFELINGGR